MVKNDSLIKPFLKWAGGKRQLLPAIKKCLPANIHNYTYYEPFIGAGAVFFALQPHKAVINDFNTQLILTYMAIKEHVEDLIKLLSSYQNKNTKDYFYQTRNLDREPREFEQLSNTEKAARLIFLNKTCFNGLYRVNAQGLFNAPYGNYKNPAICEENTLRHISAYLNANDISITNYDFEIAVADSDKYSFIYFDPPYHSPDKTNFTSYLAAGFSEAEQERLHTVFVRMTKQGAKCLLSNSDTDFIRNLYKDYKILSTQAKRVINSNATGRGFVNEVLIKNWND
ncbi:MAG: Dam family site-specific DNA-(adenine-N6)-methyltransferase [Treponema sp.]|jgi:DNA adenine methylase|nr:Dam family site-specific DNA-(adenine-N6)-methyltransferase [Treponema sp.]